jgi:hypothetical protein
MHKSIRFTLNLSPEQYLSYYQGHARRVSLIADDGRRVEFPANALRPFVSQQGVQGDFELLIDDNNRLLNIKRLAGL